MHESKLHECVYVRIYMPLCNCMQIPAMSIHALYILSKNQNLKFRCNVYHGRPFGKPLTNVLICRLPDRCLSMCEVNSASWFIKF